MTFVAIRIFFIACFLLIASLIFAQNSPIEEEPKPFEHHNSYHEQIEKEESKSQLQKNREAAERAKANDAKYKESYDDMQKSQQAIENETSSQQRSHLQPKK